MTTTTLNPADALGIADALESVEDARAQAALDDRTAALLRRMKAAQDVGDRQERLLLQAQVIAEACGGHGPDEDGDGDPYYSTADVLSWIARAVERECAMPRLGPTLIADLTALRVIPNARLREAVEEREAREGDGIYTRLAEAIGYGHGEHSPRAGTTYVKRLLGMETNAGKKGYPPTLRLFMSYEHAATFAQVLDLAFQTIGV